eukprot:m.1596924 g.1596924  ORF g.1596924 m.1596924 type:complete len:417 (+) comp25343_c2_seq8:364-1614(+)
MAEPPAQKSLFKKSVKAIARKREKLKQKMSKDGNYVDADFVELKANFEKQQNQAHRVVKDIQKYMKALDAMMQASKSLGDSIKTVYEPDWPGSNAAYNSITGLDVTFQDVRAKLTEHFAEPMKSYLGQFPDIKKRIEKRERRQLDHDRCKRAVEAARQKGSKRINELEDSYVNAQTEYDSINNEVYEVLPTFYDGRVAFYGQHFQTLYATLASFHETVAGTTNELAVTMDELFTSGSSMHEMRDRTSSDATSESHAAASRVGDYVGDAELEEFRDQAGADGDAEKVKTIDIEAAIGVGSTSSSDPLAALNASGTDEQTPVSLGAADAEPPTGASASASAASTPKADLDPTRIIEKRIASHPYAPQDDDELSFAQGAIISVVPFPDPEDEEDGWLYGYCDGKEGVFPANFTQPMAGS